MTDDIPIRILGEIQGTVTQIDKKVDALNDRFSARLDHHSGRIGRLERRLATIAGASAVIGVGVGAFFKRLLNGD
jgi:hypothetical protein